MNAASSKPPRPKGHHGGFWMLNEDALIG